MADAILEEEEVDNVQVQEGVKVPYILRGEYFCILKKTDTKIKAKCKICMDGKGSLSGDIRSTGNFIRHLKQMHEWHYNKYLNHKNNLKTQMKTSKHKDHSPSSVKAWVKGFHSAVSKIKLLQLVASYIIEEIRPVVTVEKPAFRSLIKQLSGLTPPSRQTVTNYCNELQESKKTALKLELQAAKYCCTTADIWSHHNRSFMGVTGHIIDKDNLQRKSYLLACRRMKFSHNFLDIAKTLLDIHEEYDLQASKLVATVTDNASNFGKAFRIFQMPCAVNSDDEEFLDDPLQSEMEIVPLPNNLRDFVSEDYTGIMEDANQYLPEHFKCCSHTLNLIATTNAAKALEEDRNYKRAYQSAFSKSFSLWNLCSRSTNAVDIVEETCSVKLSIPCPTRWNSTYDSLSKLLSIKQYLPSLCEKLKVPKFKVADIEFLTEHLAVTRPLALAIDILQGEKNCFFGIVLPTVVQLQQSLAQNTHLTYCTALNEALLDGLRERFGYVMDFHNTASKPFILATITHPKFKLRWISALLENEQSHAEQICRNLLFKQAEVIRESLQSRENSGSEENMTLSSDDDTKFFKFMTFQKSESVSNNNSSHMECLTYLDERSKDIQVLTKYPIVKEMFLQYNTIIPSSAPVERAFSVGGQLLTPRRNKLTDETFERLLFCKYNSGVGNIS